MEPSCCGSLVFRGICEDVVFAHATDFLIGSLCACLWCSTMVEDACSSDDEGRACTRLMEMRRLCRLIWCTLIMLFVRVGLMFVESFL